MNAGYVNNVLSNSDVDLAGAVGVFGLQLSVAALCVAGFVAMRPRAKLVYSPRLQYIDVAKRPPPLEDGFLSILKVVLKQNELEMVDKIGVDSVLFISFIKMLGKIMLDLAFVAIPLCIIYFNGVKLTGGVNVIGTRVVDTSANTTSGYSLTSLSILKVHTNSSWFWLLSVLTWFITFWVFYRIHTFWRLWIEIRKTYAHSEAYLNSPHTRTLMVRHIPRDASTEADVLTALDKIGFTAKPKAILLNRDLADLPELIQKHKKYTTTLEVTLNRYLKDPRKIPINRPRCYIKDVENEIIPVSHARRLISDVIDVDKINAYSQLLNDLEERIYQARSKRDDEFPFNGSAFLAFSNAREAHVAVQSLEASSTLLLKDWRLYMPKVELSPNFNDIYWNNLGLSFYKYAIRKLMAFLAYIGLMLSWFAVLYVIVTLLSVRMIHRWWPALGMFVLNHPVALIILRMLIAPSILAIVQILPPYIFFYLSKAGGTVSRTATSQITMQKFFIFAVFQMFTVFGGQSIVYPIRSRMLGIHSSNHVHIGFNAMVSIDIVTLSSFFVTYVGTGIIGQAFELLQVGSNLIVFWRWCFNRNTPRKEFRMKRIPQPQIGTFYGQALFLFGLTLVYSIISPVIVVVGLILFWVSYLVMKYQFMYVYQQRADTGGSWWPKVFKLMVFLVFLFQIATFIAIDVIGVSLQSLSRNKAPHQPNNMIPAFFALASVSVTVGAYIYATFYVMPEGEFMHLDIDLKDSNPSESTTLLEATSPCTTPSREQCLPSPTSTVESGSTSKSDSVSVTVNPISGSSHKRTGSCMDIRFKNNVLEGLYDPALIDPLWKLWIWKRSSHLLRLYHTCTYNDLGEYMASNGTNSSLASNNGLSGTLNRHKANYLAYSDIQLLRNRRRKLNFVVATAQQVTPGMKLKRNPTLNKASLSRTEEANKEEYDAPPEIRMIVEQADPMVGTLISEASSSSS